jgi:CheY-like chemotaxis protein
MTDLESFTQELQDVLAHLHDPDYQPAEHIYAIMGCDPEQGPAAVQSTVIQWIRSLEPDSTVPPGSRARRDFEVLHHRFMLKLTQEETAERLYMSVRSVQREQRRAVYALARGLWDRGHPRAPSHHIDQDKGALPQATEWMSQVREELVSLQRYGAGAEADLEAAVRGALRLARTTSSHHGIDVETGHIQSGLTVRFHPSALRQVLLTAITELTQSMSPGTITLSAESEQDRARIVITAHLAVAQDLVDVSLARELVSAQGGSIESLLDQGRVSLIVELPIVERTEEKVTVLAIDDNVDLITLYRSYCTDTAYDIVHVREGLHALEAIRAHSPDIILLDVMLPDMDGWDLLLDLRASPESRSTPIIVCSVITDEELALTLGAALYLRKPVWREQLIEAFDQVLSQVGAEASKA